MKRFIVSILFAIGCGHGSGDIDSIEGKACSSDRDCDHHCYSGGDFPGGFCSVPCTTDADCPDDSLCMAEAEGVCMFACPPFDCSRLGTGWSCQNVDHRGGGQASVCSGN